MRFESVKAHAFGPFAKQQLPLTPGMNVVYGPNEAGKSTWHAALYAGLCGMRRARGRATRPDEVFASRHKPWDGDGNWEVGAVVALEDGRSIELRHDLAGRVDSSARDVTFADRDYSKEIMTSEGPDGARWLGFDRRSFLTTACVRQADILDVVSKESATSLQDELQRAAATARQGSSAAAAIALLTDFERDRIGTPRAPTKPLLQAQSRLQTAVRALESAKDEHENYLALAGRVEEARVTADVADREARAARAARAMDEQTELAKKLDAARQLARDFPQGEPPSALADEEDDAQTVATELARWDGRPTPTLPQERSLDIEARLADLRDRSRGDLDVHESVQSAAAQMNAAGALLARIEADQPSAVERPDVGSANVEDLYSYASALETARTVAPAQPRGLVPAWAGLAVVLAVGGVVALLTGRVLPAVLLLIGGAGAAGAHLLLRARVSRVGGDAGNPTDSVRRTVEQLGLPESPADLRALAQGLLAFEERERVIQAWEEQRQGRTQDVAAAEKALLDALMARGVEVAEGEVEQALVQYELACTDRRGLAARIPQAEADLHASKSAEEAYAGDSEQLAAIERDLRALASRLDPNGRESPSPEDCVERLREWQKRRVARAQGIAERHARWTRLEAIQGAITLEQLEGRSREATVHAAALATGIDADALNAAVEQLDTFGAEWFDRKQSDAARQREGLAGLEEHLRQRAAAMLDVAAAEEELRSAESELERLQGLARVVQQTITFLRDAEERVHRDIAPVLSKTVMEWLPRVTGYRYTDCRVNPQTLAVEVCGDGGRWRNAQLLSHGTAEQVYLLLRVALARHLTKPGEICPLILDDVVAACDADRKRAVLEMLLTLSESVQVILFTHEDDVRGWARERLTGPRHHLEELGAAVMPA